MQLLENVIKRKGVCTLPFFCLAGWNVDITDVAPATIVDHEVMWVSGP